MSFPSGVIGGLLAAAAISWALAPQQSPGNSRVLRHGIRSYILAFGLLLVGVFVFSLFGVYPPRGQDLTTLIIRWFFLLGGGWLVLDVLFVKVRLGTKELEVRSPWWRVRRVPWSEVTGCVPSKWKNYHDIHTRSHGVLRVPDLPGIALLLHEIDPDYFARRRRKERPAKPPRRSKRKRRR